MFTKNKFVLALLAASVGLSACSNESADVDVAAQTDVENSSMEVVFNESKLQNAIMSRSEEERARDNSRHPAETLEFFQIAPGMSVAEALPGGGWYSKILAPYLGDKGQLHGINYNADMWARFGFFSEERIKEMTARTGEFPELVAGFADNGPTASGFTFATAPEELAGSVDRVLFIRALHNLNRFEGEAGTMSEALATAHMLLKDSGLVGVVQHQGPETSSDDWASGRSGYLKKSTVIKAFTDAGFELVSESDINANPKDIPTEDDIVWRLPPSYNQTADDPVLKAEVDAIGESNRMTLLFKKVSK
jgi:predicted methyltransferase